jgi:lipid-A-disaccharide synthase
MLGASTLIAKKIKNTQFVLAKPPQISSDIYQYFLNRFDIEVKIIEGRTYDCLSVADYAFVCSGTATLETAIMQKPFAVVYKMRLLNYLLYRPQIRIPHIGMVNIVAGKKIVPEFIQFGARPEQLAQEALRILQDSSEAKRMQKALGEVISALGERNASTRAAQVILDFLKGPFTQP